MAQGCVTNSLVAFVCAPTADCILMVWPASWLVARLITLTRLCVFTLNRTGPLGEAAVLGTYAKLPCVAMPFNWLGYAPVVNVKSDATGFAGAAMCCRASPAALKPVSATGGSLMFAITESDATEMAVTNPALALSNPSGLLPDGSARKSVTYST